MVKLLVLLARQDRMSQEAFELHVRKHHLLPVTQLPGLRRLLVNRVVPDPRNPAPTYDAVAELWFDDYPAVGAAFASPAGQAVMADAPNFLDMRRSQVLFVIEEPFPLPPAPNMSPAT